MATIDTLIQARMAKLEELKKRGIDPYPATVKRQQTVVEARGLDGKHVSVAGRIMGIRGHGGILFWDIQDGSGKIQVVLKSDACEKASFTLIESLDIGDFISVQGTVGKTQAGELSVFAESFQIITKTIRPLPHVWYGLKDIEERYRKRYLDTLLNQEVKDRLVARSKVIDAVRDFLTDRGFLEVETPTLQPVYGGGFARPFITHHNELDSDFYLRISDEMYLKRLVVGGFDKVFEITKVFRNEGIDHDHNPEFTMFEAQIAYEDYRYGMDIIEEIMEYTVKRVAGGTKVTYQGRNIDFKRPWVRHTMVDAIKKYTGHDPLSWTSLADAKEAVKQMNIPEKTMKSLHRMQTVGEIIAFVFEEKVEDKLIQPTIIYDFPIEVSPLAKKCKDERFTQRFEQFVNGSELGNNYSELNDPIDLRQRFIEEKKREESGFKEAHQTDLDYLEAIEHGFPPTCGIAIGIDRFVKLLTDAKNLKEIIPFPTLKPEAQSAHKIDYPQAQKLMEQYLKDPVNRMHSIESEAIMRSLAKHLGEDEESWGIIGLLHDIDWELTKDDTRKHCIKTAEILQKAGGTQRLIETIQSHGYGQVDGNEYYGPPEFKGKERSGTVQHALAAAETVTGLIIATTLVQPDKKLASVKPESLMKKFKSKSFAANCKREIMLECEKIGMSLDDFLSLSLKALQSIHEKLGL
ncbi:lysine--tRNA ligase [Patescibacteria group bacterium]|nr:lysine--tRNA ligase [Patescibacteria group bacterium]MBU1472697.1 lysine--tRNA ligase [Patescibacteria group bacterium]MBU2459964.1 lysine--tRNA ligase [Patescibacteria group bacterium]MBU2544378.1 lysine--tRNA ligase [Patescibacteria group bacterium]